MSILIFYFRINSRLHENEIHTKNIKENKLFLRMERKRLKGRERQRRYRAKQKLQKELERMKIMGMKKNVMEDYPEQIKYCPAGEVKFVRIHSVHDVRAKVWKFEHIMEEPGILQEASTPGYFLLTYISYSSHKI